MPTVYVNDKPVEIGSRKLNCIQAAELAGVFIPSYCWHEALTVVASCRMCLVEVGTLKDGKLAMQPKVVPGLPDAGRGRHGHRDGRVRQARRRTRSPALRCRAT